MSQATTHSVPSSQVACLCLVHGVNFYSTFNIQLRYHIFAEIFSESPVWVRDPSSGLPQHPNLNRILALSSWGSDGLFTYLPPHCEQFEVRGWGHVHP